MFDLFLNNSIISKLNDKTRQPHLNIARWQAMVTLGSNIAEILDISQAPALKLPLYLAQVSAGFPSPADDHIDQKLDLNQYLIKHPAATFFVRVAGESMLNAGIHPGDLLIVDRALSPNDNKVVIAAIHGELTVKRIVKKQNKLYLMPENNQFKPIEIKAENDLEIWGVVTYVIHAL